ncbi:MAG: hypothetical protein V7K97_29910 [Nostoc sp.]|uniref:hypothetical protein n=1 Tax=Nostoc sp. TaxID=1180 RepID=UPI002FF4A579
MIKLNKLTLPKLYSSYCQLHKKWGIVVILPYSGSRDPEEDKKAIEFNLPQHKKYWETTTDVMIDALVYTEVLFTTDTEEEMWNIYTQIRGKDGLPNDPSPGECYAYTCSPEGIILTENT